MSQLPPLGVTNLVGASCSILNKKFLPVLVAAYVPYLILALISNSMMSAIFQNALANPNDPFAIFGSEYFIFLGVTSVFGILLFSFVALLCGTVVQGAPLNIGENLSVILKRSLILILVSVLVYLGMGVGFMLFIIPGLILMAAWSVAIPSILFENRGFDAIGYSFDLTQGYRWPIIGGFLLLGIVLGVVSFIVQFVLGFGIAATDPAAAMLEQPIWLVVLNTVFTAVYVVILTLFTVLLYTRLKDIKEGGSGNVEEVFA